MENQLPKANINLANVFLNSSVFNKGEESDPGDLQLMFSIEPRIKDETNISFLETILLKSDESEFTFEIKMEAHFTKAAEDDLSIDKFAHLNAAPIIYGFIRQHVSYITLSAGMKPITLPLVNFYDYYKNNIEGKEE